MIVFPGLLGSISAAIINQNIPNPQFTGSAVLAETFEYPNWPGTYDISYIPSPSFTGSFILAEGFEYPNWPGTYDIGYIPNPQFTGSAVLSEEFESGW
jgi:hypothetical protein